jgi:hypothetical protein
MRPGKFMRCLLVVAGAAFLAGTSTRTEAADHRGNGYQYDNAIPKATYPPRANYSRGDRWSHGRQGGGYRDHGYAGSIVAVPIIVAPPMVYPSQHPYYVQQPYPQQPYAQQPYPQQSYPAYQYVPPPAPTYYGR